MDMTTKQNSFRLGRRPAKQGPRPLSSNQGRVGKSPTGRNTKNTKNTSNSCKVKILTSVGQAREVVQLRKVLRAGTWNVRSMLQLGKVQMLSNELERNRVDFCGLSEVRWAGQGHFTTLDGHTVIYSGAKKQGQRGVALWIHRKVAGAIIGYEPINDRILIVRINAKPRCLSIVQVYAPTSTATKEDMEQFYEELDAAVKKVPKRDVLLVMGDFNAKVGKRTSDAFATVVGTGGLGVSNEAGERLLDFCLDHEMSLCNTWFEHHPRRLYTWTSPDGQTRNQIDYIAIAQRWRSSVRNCKAYPGADCDSDHNLLVAKIKVKLTQRKKLEHPKRLNLEELKGPKAAVFTVEVKNRFEALQWDEEERTPDELWQETKTILLDVAKKTLGYKKAQNRKPWISDESLALIKAKREAKSKDLKQYKELKTEVQKKLREDKKVQLENLCEELEGANKKGNMRHLFQTVRTLTRKFQPRLHCIQSASGEMITESSKIAERWSEYCEALYDDSEVKDIDRQFTREPAPLKSEVARAIGETASGRSTGPDEVPAELFKHGGETTVERMHRICEALWETGEWPADWTSSVFIPLPKKGDMRQCTNYRTIALVSHASKIILKIILERIRMKTESEVADEQAGFRKGRGTRDQVTNLRIIMQKTREHQQPLYLCFVDFKKAFDCVSHEKLWMAMIDMGYPIHVVNLLAELYRKQQAKVRAAGSLSRGFRVKKGVRQGCVISPYLFNILAEMVMREALDGYDGGIQIGGRKVTNLRYADDIVLLATSEAELQEIVDRLDRASSNQGLLINVDKTKVMATNGTTCNIRVQGNQLEQVDTFPYLGSLITEDSECSKDIRSRLAKGQGVGTALKNVWKSHGISLTTKLRLLKALVWPVAQYGCESWTIKKDEEARINAFEMKCLRQILRVPWTAKKTNEWVLETAGVERSLLGSIKKRKLSYFGHVLQKSGDCLEKEIIQGTIPGSRARGRPKMTWIDNIKSWTELSFAQLIQETSDRNGWRRIVHGAAYPRLEDG